HTARCTSRPRPESVPGKLPAPDSAHWPPELPPAALRRSQPDLLRSPAPTPLPSSRLQPPPGPPAAPPGRARNIPPSRPVVSSRWSILCRIAGRMPRAHLSLSSVLQARYSARPALSSRRSFRSPSLLAVLILPTG